MWPCSCDYEARSLLYTFGDFCSGRKAAQNPLSALVVGVVEPAQQGFKIRVVRDVDRQDFGCNTAVEPLDHAIRLGRVGPGPSPIYALILACFLKRIRSKAGAAIGQDMGYFEWKSGFGGLEKIDGIGRILGVVDGQMHEARAAIDRDVEEPFAGLTICGLQLRQMLHVDMDIAQVIIPEGALSPRRADLLLRRPAIEACVLEDAPDAVAVEVGRKCRSTKVRSSSPNSVTRRRWQTIARSSSVAFQASNRGLLLRSVHPSTPRLRHLRTVSSLMPKRRANTPVASVERAISARTDGVVRACGWI